MKKVWIGLLLLLGSVLMCSARTTDFTLLKDLQEKYATQLLSNCALNSTFLRPFSAPLRNKYYKDETDFYLKEQRTDDLNQLLYSLEEYLKKLPPAKKEQVLQQIDSWCFFWITVQHSSARAEISSEFLLEDILYEIVPFKKLIGKYFKIPAQTPSSLSSTQMDLAMNDIYSYYAMQPVKSQQKILNNYFMLLGKYKN